MSNSKANDKSSTPSSSSLSSPPKNFLESDGSLFRNSLLLDETRETLMAMESEGVPSLLSGGGDGDTATKIFTPSQREEVDNCKFIVPEPGRCIKTMDKKSGEKVFINICKSHKVPEPPIDFTEAQLLSILGDDGTDEEIDDVRIPMSIGDKRVEKDKNGNQCQAYDIIINSTFYQEKVLTSELYWTFLCVISLEALDDKYKLELGRNYIIMKHKQCHGKPLPQFVRSKAGIREISENIHPSSVSTPFIRPAANNEVPIPKPGSSSKTGTTASLGYRPPAVKELKTTYFPKPDPYRKLVVNLWRYKESPFEAEAEIHLPGLKDIKEVTVSYEKDEIKLASPVGQCQLKCPININTDKSWPKYDPIKKILTLHLRLDPLTDQMLKEWKKVGHDLSSYEEKLCMKFE